MALSVSMTGVLGQFLKPGMRIASMGYPDIVAPIEMVETLMGEKFKNLEYRKDSDQICKRHGLEPRQIPDAHSLFRLMDCELDVYDIVEERGCEILCDLNYPMEPKDYDIVLDVGTSEHVMNVYQALVNMAGMVKGGGGVIIHENPANWGNHGFYNFNPTLFYDFYTDNGFEVEILALVTREGRRFQAPPVQRFKFPPGEMNIFCLARRSNTQTFIPATQTKYKSIIKPHAASETG